MAASPADPQRRVADSIFRMDMLGPTFGHFAASLTGLLLVETLMMEYFLPPWALPLQALDVSLGRTKFCFTVAFVISMVGFWGFGTLFAIPAILRVEQWKIQVNRTLDLPALLRAMPLVAFNFLCGTVFSALALLKLLPETSFDWSDLPSTSILARDIVVWLLVEEVVFFYVHRWLHEDKKMYAAVHKLHHTWTAPVSLVAIYCHPFEHIASNIVPLLAGPVLCRSHVAAVVIYIFLGLIHTTAVHSGYWFCDDNGMHDEHHRKFTVNYGVMGLMDSWYGTYRLPAGASAAEGGKRA